MRRVGPRVVRSGVGQPPARAVAAGHWLPRCYAPGPSALRYRPIGDQKVGNARELADVVRYERSSDCAHGGGDPQICFADCEALAFEVSADCHVMLFHPRVRPGDAERRQKCSDTGLALCRTCALRGADQQFGVDLEWNRDIDCRSRMEPAHRQRRLAAQAEDYRIRVEKMGHARRSVTVETVNRARWATPRTGKRVVIREGTK